MPQILDNLASQVASTVGVIDSTIVFINGLHQRLVEAVAAAVAGGATAEELAPVQAEADALKAKSDELAAAVAANP